MGGAGRICRGDPADAFDVFVPSLPGFGFSAAAGEPGHDFWKLADLWHTLMTDTLGHEKYAAAGCDIGALVTGRLGHQYADELHAIHIGSGLELNLFNGDGAWGPQRRTFTDGWSRVREIRDATAPGRRCPHPELRAPRGRSQTV
ncbi:alpha/beta fold hydrolase [Streptomyces sp. NPDC055157]